MSLSVTTAVTRGARSSTYAAAAAASARLFWAVFTVVTSDHGMPASAKASR